MKEKEEKISSLSQKLERLLTGYLNQVIDEQDYRNQKAKLLSEKKSLEEEMTSLSHEQNDWLAPFQNWLKDAQSLDKIASDNNLSEKKVVAKEIFGSNLVLAKKQCASPKATLRIRLEKWGEISGRRFAPPTKKSVNL